MEWKDENPYYRVFDETRRTGNLLGILFSLAFYDKRKLSNTFLIFSENFIQDISRNILREILKIIEGDTDGAFTKSWLNYLWRREI